jgi:hypothetical protein
MRDSLEKNVEGRDLQRLGSNRYFLSDCVPIRVLPYAASIDRSTISAIAIIC